MTLEEQIRDAIARGDMTHLSVSARADGTWSATFAPAASFGAHHATERDPVKAMQNAIGAAKLARKPRATVTKPGETPPAEPLDFG